MTTDDDLAAVLHRLHGLPPEEFVAARNAAARELTGKAAKTVKSLRRPTAAAWAVNRLVRERPEPVQALADLGEQLRDAQAAGDGAAMRELDRERRRRTAAAVAAADDVAGGLAGTAREGVESTLRAVVLDPEAADRVLEGNLASALSASGFATVSSASSAPRRRAPAPRRKQGDDDRAERLAAARKQLEESRAALAEADAAADRAEQQRDDAADAADAAAGRLERARAALAEAEAEHEDATSALGEADEALDEARDEADAAALAVSSAERDVEELERDD